MTGGSEPRAYEPLDSRTLRDVLADLPDVRGALGGRPEGWRIREVGDGNLNLVFLVEGPRGTCCVKQALPYVRAAGPSWPMSPERAFFEACYYEAVAPHVGPSIPRVHHYDPRLHCIVMERLSPHVILREGLIAGRRYPRVAHDLGEYVANACFFTSGIAAPLERRMEDIARFARNHELVRITADLVFTDPYRDAPRNRHTSPGLDSIAADLRDDGALKVAAARFGQKFLTEAQALIHGDLHSGSVMVTEDDSRVIDPEFAFYGPIGFDLGAFFGNLLIAWYAQPGHARPGDERREYRDWILEQARIFWESFRERFASLWREEARGDAYPALLFASAESAAALEAARNDFLDGLLRDMLGFAACKMIRRILGFAHVADFERIADSRLRAACEADALALARLILTHPRQFGSVDAVMDAVPRMKGGVS